MTSTTTAMKTFSFSLTLAEVSELTPAMAEALFEICDDATPSSRAGIVTVAFDREGESLGDVIGSAIKDVERAGYAVTRVDVEASDG